MASAKSTGSALGDQDLRRRNVPGTAGSNGRIPGSADQTDDKKALHEVHH